MQRQPKKKDEQLTQADLAFPRNLRRFLAPTSHFFIAAQVWLSPKRGEICKVNLDPQELSFKKDYNLERIWSDPSSRIQMADVTYSPSAQVFAISDNQTYGT